MKRIVNITALSLFAALTACNNDPIIQSNGPEVDPQTTGGNKVSIKVYVPKGSLVTTYADEAASTFENYIDTLFIDLYHDTPPTLASRDTILSGDSRRTGADSVLDINYEVNGLTTPVMAKVYANRKTANVISSEILLPSGVSKSGTGFLMADSANIPFSNGAYRGEVHVKRNVAKLKTNVWRDPACLPQDLTIDYSNIKIQILGAPNQTSVFGDQRGVAQQQSGYAHFPYAEKSHAFPTNFNGGQIDSTYINENLRDNYPSDAEKIRVKVTIPTKSASQGDKTLSQTFTLYTNSQTNFDILRNYIYILDIRVFGQDDLGPKMSLSMQPWNDVSMDGSVLGTYLTMQKSEIEFDASGYADIAFCTDAQAVYVDYSDIAAQIGQQVSLENVYPNDVSLMPGYQGQVLMDKKVCTSFGLRLPQNTNPESVSLSGRICIKAGNIRKCIAFVPKKFYDAHFIVGDTLLNGEQFTSADIVIESGGAGWLEVSKDRQYTSNVGSSYNDAAASIFLHLGENLTGSIRKGSITLKNSNSSTEKKIYIQQLPALRVGSFISDSLLWTEQLYEYSDSKLPIYGGNLTTTPDITENGEIRNGLLTAKAIFDRSGEGTKYAGGTTLFDWQTTVYQAINYCAFKNRPAQKGGTMSKEDIKWYLPSQAELMALWVSYDALKNEPTSNFRPTNQYSEYLSATNNSTQANVSNRVNLYHGNIGGVSRTGQFRVRCVRKVSTTPLPSPMVELPAVADPNNGLGVYVNFYNFLPSDAYTSVSKINNNPPNDTLEFNTKVYRRLLVSLQEDGGTRQNWNRANEICASKGAAEWRLPTQKELQAIWLLMPQIELVGGTNFVHFFEQVYWTKTRSTAQVDERAYYISMYQTPAGTAANTPQAPITFGSSQQQYVYVRCVKEVP